MKRVYAILLALSLLTLTACGEAEFEGSRLGSDSELTMEFKILNKTDTQDLTLEDGEQISAQIQLDGGSLSVTIQSGEDAPVYEDADIRDDTTFTAAPEAGTYTVTVSGCRAKGSVCFTVEPMP